VISEAEQARLEALEKRIAAAKAAHEPQRSAKEEGHRQGQLAWRMVIELVAGLMIGFGIGYGLDTLLGTMPIFLVLFILLGFAAGVKTMLQSAREMQAKQLAAMDANAAAVNDHGADDEKDD
jgi:ATP synthase protein I